MDYCIFKVSVYISFPFYNLEYSLVSTFTNTFSLKEHVFLNILLINFYKRLINFIKWTPFIGSNLFFCNFSVWFFFTRILLHNISCCVQLIRTSTVKFHNSLNYWYRKTRNRLNINLAMVVQLLNIWLPVNQLSIFCWLWLQLLILLLLIFHSWIFQLIFLQPLVLLLFPQLPFLLLPFADLPIQCFTHDILTIKMVSTKKCNMRWKLRWNESSLTFLPKVRPKKAPGFLLYAWLLVVSFFFIFFYISFFKYLLLFLFSSPKMVGHTLKILHQMLQGF